MAEEIKLQVGSFGAESFTDSFFAELPSDGRFSKVTYHEYFPQNAVGQTELITILFPSYGSSSVYMFDKALVLLDLKLTDLKGDALKDGSYACPVNLALYSCFSDIRAYVENVNINPISSQFHIKNYLETLVTYDTNFKKTVLAPAGYTYETHVNMDSLANAGMQKRIKEYAETRKDAQGVAYFHYTGQSVFYCGRLNGELQGLHNLVNGVNVKIEFQLAPASFFLMTDDNTWADGIKFVIDKMSVRVPVGELSSNAALKLENTLKTRPSLTHYKRRQLVPYQVPLHSTVFAINGKYNNNNK